MSQQAAPINRAGQGNRPTARRRVSIVQGIGRTLLISSLILTLLPLIALGIISGAQASASLINTAQAQLINVADLREQTVRDWLNERKQDLVSLRNDAQTEDWIRTILRAVDTSAQRSSLLTLLQEEVAHGGGFKRMFLIDGVGISVVSTDPTILGKGHAGQPYTTVSSPEPFATLYYETERGEREIAVAQGIFDSNNQQIGTLVGTTDLSRLSDIMDAGARLGQTDESYLVDDNYRFLTKPQNTTSLIPVTTQGVDEALKSPIGTRLQGSYKNYEDIDVYGTYRTIPDLGRVVLVTEQATSEVLAPVQVQTRGILVMLGLASIVAVVGAYLLTRRIVRPINSLTEVAEQVTAGDLNQIATVKRNDQIGQLAASFNTMTARLRDMIDSLETRVEMRTAQVQASADVGRVVTSILDPDQLLKRVVQLITERFGFYYAAAFTLDPSGQWAVLREAAGPGDSAWLLKQAGHRLELAGNSMVAACLRTRRARVALDVGAEAVRFANPLLPETRSEVALPLIVGDQIVGALDVQSVQVAAFDETSTAVLQNMADQIAVALNNAAQYRHELMRVQQTTHLLEATVELTTHAQTVGLYNRIVELTATLLNADSAALWQPIDNDEIEMSYAVGHLHTLLGRRAPTGEGIAGRVFATSLALRLDDARTWKDVAVDFGDLVVHAVLAVPMIWQDQVIGVLVAARTLPDIVFSPDDGNVAQLFAAQTASAIENTRLLNQIQNTLNELSTANKRLIGEAWRTHTHGQEVRYEYLRTESSRGMTPAVSMTLPVELRGQPIGQFILEDTRPQRELTEDERAVVQGIIQQMSLALESARLFEQTQSALGEARRLAQRERLINRITTQLRGATTVDEVLHIAADEMRRAVRTAYTTATLTVRDSSDNGQGDEHDSQ